MRNRAAIEDESAPVPVTQTGERALWGVLLGVFAAAAVGTSFVASSELIHFPFLGGQALRYAAGALALALIVRLGGRTFPRPDRRQWLLLIALGTTGQAGFNLAVLAALRTVEPAAVSVVVGCVPIVLALADWVIWRRRLPVSVFAGAALVVAGATVVQGFGRSDVVGGVFALIALACETAFSLLAVPLLPALGAMAVSLYACAIAAVELAVAAVVLDRSAALAVPTWPEGLALVWLAVVVTAVAFVCWYTALDRLGAGRAGLLAGLIPVVTALVAPVVGSADLGVVTLGGCALVGLGVALGLRPARSAAPAT